METRYARSILVKDDRRAEANGSSIIKKEKDRGGSPKSSIK